MAGLAGVLIRDTLVKPAWPAKIRFWIRTAMTDVDPDFSVETYENVRIFPTRCIWQDEISKRHKYDGGVYTEVGHLIEIAKHTGGGALNAPAAQHEEVPQKKISGNQFFGGWLRDHFGHFINESLSRFWHLKELDEKIDGVTFVAYGLFDPKKGAARVSNILSKKFITDVFEMIGLNSAINIVTEPCMIERLIIPKELHFDPIRGSIRAAHMHQKIFAQMARSPLVKNTVRADRVYLSRSRLGGGNSQFVLENVLEENLLRSGYMIAHSELMSVADQIAIYSNAKTLIFAEGSTIHFGAPFCTGGKKAAIIARRFGHCGLFKRQLLAGGCTEVDVIAEQVGLGPVSA